MTRLFALALMMAGCDNVAASHDIGCFLYGFALGLFCSVAVACLLSDEDEVSP